MHRRVSNLLYFFSGSGGYGASSIATPDMEDVKESVRQGVTKVAGKLSNMASGVMTQLQVKLCVCVCKMMMY